MCYKNSCIIFNALDSNPIGVLAELNWFQGGAACTNLAFTGSTDKGAGVTLQNNRYVRSSGYHIYQKTGWLGTLSGNVYDDDGTAVSPVLY